MTKCRPWLLALLVLALAPALPAGAYPPPNLPPLPRDVVAQVEGRQLTFDAFCRVAVQHATRDLIESKSGPRAILDKMCEELMVLQWCERYGLQVTKGDIDRRWRKLSEQVAARTGGAQTLRDLIAEDGSSVELFRMKLAHEMRKELVADKRLNGSLPKHDEAARFRQAKLVIAKLLTDTKIEYGLPVVDHLTPTPMPVDQVCRVNGQPITRAQFGKQLVHRMPLEDVRTWLDKECKIGLMAAAGVRLTDEALSEELERMRKLWPMERTVQREVVWTTVGFNDRFKAQWKIPVEIVPKSRFMRGFFGLVRQFRPEVTEAEVRQDFETRKDELYGPHFIVTDIKAQFVQRNDPFGRGGRTRREALREIRSVIAASSSGQKFESLVSGIQAKRDPTFTALKIRVFDRREDRDVWDRVKDLQDGEVSSPFDTLSEVHVLRREGTAPRRTYDEIKDLLREFRSRNKARDWLGKRLADPNHVRVVWPFPQLGKIVRKGRRDPVGRPK